MKTSAFVITITIQKKVVTTPGKTGRASKTVITLDSNVTLADLAFCIEAMDKYTKEKVTTVLDKYRAKNNPVLLDKLYALSTFNKNENFN